MKSNKSQGWMRAAVCSVGLAAILSATGCQVDVGGQTLPSPYYRYDDVQYFAPTSENKLAREAAAMKAYNADLQLQGQQP